MKEQDYTIRDMIAHSMDGNATKVMSAFDHLIGPKIVQAIADKKIEVARSMFASNEDEQEEIESSSEDEEDNESQETDIEAENDKDTEPA